jgi:hypothetical protein
MAVGLKRWSLHEGEGARGKGQKEANFSGKDSLDDTARRRQATMDNERYQ